MKKFLNSLFQEFLMLHFPLVLARMVLAVFPPYTANKLRSRILRLAGFSIGKRCVFFGIPTIVGSPDLHAKLAVGNDCLVSVDCYFDLAGKITIHDNTGMGPQTMIITGTHKIGGPSRRLGNLVPQDVEIGSGVWIGARCTILPGVKIGNGVVVAAGAVVTKNVPDNVLVGGVPAKIIRELDPCEQVEQEYCR